MMSASVGCVNVGLRTCIEYFGPPNKSLNRCSVGDAACVMVNHDEASPLAPHRNVAVLVDWSYRILLYHPTARESSPCQASAGDGECVSGSARFC